MILMDSTRQKSEGTIKMEYNKAINMMQIGDDVEGFYILKGAYPKWPAMGGLSECYPVR